MIKKYLSIFYFSGLLAIPLVLLVLPANFFDEGDPVCLSQILLQTSCFGCGMTRAIQHLIHFDFSIAYEYNKIAFLVFPLLVYLWIKEVIVSYTILTKAR